MCGLSSAGGVSRLRVHHRLYNQDRREFHIRLLQQQEPEPTGSVAGAASQNDACKVIHYERMRGTQISSLAATRPGPFRVLTERALCCGSITFGRKLRRWGAGSEHYPRYHMTDIHDTGWKSDHSGDVNCRWRPSPTATMSGSGFERTGNRVPNVARRSSLPDQDRQNGRAPRVRRPGRGACVRGSRRSSFMPDTESPRGPRAVDPPRIQSRWWSSRPIVESAATTSFRCS